MRGTYRGMSKYNQSVQRNIPIYVHKYCDFKSRPDIERKTVASAIRFLLNTTSIPTNIAFIENTRGLAVVAVDKSTRRAHEADTMRNGRFTNITE